MLIYYSINLRRDKLDGFAMKNLILCITVLFFSPYLLAGNFIAGYPDTLRVDSVAIKSEQFYDSLRIRAHRHRFTGFLYDAMVSGTKEQFDTELTSYEYYKQFEGKTIASIRIQPLDVFGPTFDDTARIAKSSLERFANSIHTKSNLNAIRRNLWIKEGTAFDGNLMMDNERLLRGLPYLKDVRMIVNTRIDNDELVDILVLTKDVFAFGVTGEIDEIDSGELGVYNQNVLGVGHEISAKFVGHLNREPYLGIETFYSIKNLRGDFVDFKVGYIDTYKRHGYLINFGKEFLRPKSVWAGGFNYSRYFRNERVSPLDPVQTSFPLNFQSYDVWYGRNLQLGINENDSRFQMTISGRVKHVYFKERPLPDENNNQYFANNTFYLASLSFSQRRYIRDRLIYSYGIIEDIPKGYLHELVVGYDDNEFIKRWYSHVYFSTGNIVKYKPYYLFASASIGGFFNKEKYEQGMFETNLDYISRLYNIRQNRLRQFIKINYLAGLKRFDIENLLLRYKTGIRGFTSGEAAGKQRLTCNLESVYFQKREFLNFNIAFFSFFDLGIIGSNKKIIFTQDYYAGLGFGVRLRNENLVFKTIQIRFAYYPFHPLDMGSLGFILEEQLRTRFYSFQPKAPEILMFD